MKKIFLLIVILVGYQCCFSQMYVKIISKPQYYNPLFDSLYISGTFNNWDPAHTAEILGNDLFVIPEFSGTAEYKITRGSWSAVEAAGNGSDIPNRTLTYMANDTVKIDIKQWKDFYSTSAHTSLPQVQVLKSNFFMPQLNTKRRVWIYLPKDYYNTSTLYPVMYMHDGQNLFDRPYSFVGEWKVDEALASGVMSGVKDYIVIGIDNGGSERINEYTPYRHPNYGGGKGELYAEFLVNTLKPFIDDNFRTLPEPQHTGIAGSSLGGLISFYTGIKYPHIFGKVGVFSPSFWYSDSMYVDVDNFIPDAAQKIYIVAGQNEDEDMVPDIDIYINKLKDRGFSEENLKRVIHSDGAHSEWYWAREFPAAYKWLDLWETGLGYDILVKSENYLVLNANPSGTPTFYIKKPLSGKKTVTIVDVNGKSIQTFYPADSSPFSLDSSVTPGIYFATFTVGKHMESLKFIKN